MQNINQRTLFFYNLPWSDLDATNEFIGDGKCGSRGRSELVKGTAPEKIVPDKTLSDGGGAPEHQTLRPRTAELAQTPVWWESTRKREKWSFF